MGVLSTLECLKSCLSFILTNKRPHHSLIHSFISLIISRFTHLLLFPFPFYLSLMLFIWSNKNSWYRIIGVRSKLVFFLFLLSNWYHFDYDMFSKCSNRTTTIKKYKSTVGRSIYYLSNFLLSSIDHH